MKFTAPANQDTIDEAPAIELQLPADNNKPSNANHEETVEDGDHQTRAYKARKAAVMMSLYLTLFLAVLNITIVAVALPTIVHDLHSSAGYTWVGAAYLLADAASGPVWTNFSNIWGRKKVLLVAVALFILSSLICALSKSMAMLITGRALQGAGAGAITLLVHIVISDMFDMRKRSLYLGLCEVVWAVSGAIGPLTGGALAEYASWRWIWWIQLPLGGISFFGLALYLDVHNPRTPVWAGIKAIDWLGSLTLLAMTLMILLGLNFGGQVFSWSSPQVLVLIILGAAISVIFLLIEAKVAKYPVLPLKVFRSGSNIGTLVLAFAHAFSIMGPEYYMALFFQSAKFARPLRSGLLGLPFIFGTAVAGIASGIIINRTGRYRMLIWIGAVFLALGYGLFIDFDARSGLIKTVMYQIIAAIGSGLLLQPPLTAIQANVSQQDTATATATLSFTRQIAQLISIVVGGVVLSSSMNLNSPGLHSVGLSKTQVQWFSGAEAQANVDKLRDLYPLRMRLAVQDVYASSFRNLWIMYAGCAALSIPAAYFIKAHSLSTQHVETRTGLHAKDT